MEFRDYYSDLGVPPDADEAAIKRAYRKLAREHHPDRGGSVQAMQELNREYRRLQEAMARAS